MEIILKTGFEKITHDIQFQPETVPKGKRLVEASHVCNVVEHRKNDRSYLIEAQVIRQASVSSQPYCTKLNIDTDRKVTSVSCTCVYNKSGKCKHMAALIHYINNNESLSKTDVEQQWGRPSEHKLTQEKYSKGKYFHEMYPPSNKLDVSPLALDLDDLQDPSPLRAVFLEAKKDKNQKAVHNLMGCLLSEVERILQKDMCTACVHTLFELSEDHLIYMAQEQVPRSLQYFYNTSVSLTRAEIIQLCCNTLEQSKSAQWFEARSIRISASANVHSIKSRSKKPIEKLVYEMLQPKAIDTTATRYGRKHEVHALAEYELQFKVHVEKVGLLVSQKQSWLCASLDGVVTKNGSIQKIVEFKCPITCETIPVVDFQNKKCHVKYLQFEKNGVCLKTSNSYYTQCQTQMYVCGADECDLFIYSPVPNGSCCVSVERDEKFLKTVIPKCEEFYFHHYLPKLIEKSQKENQMKNTYARVVQPTRCFTGSDVTNEL